MKKRTYLLRFIVLGIFLLLFFTGHYWKEREQSVFFEHSEKICYLTFDDGPSHNTEKILDILKEYDAHATFFVIGNELTEEWKPLFERMKEEGHVIGLHANDHNYQKLYCSLDSFLADYKALEQRLKTDFGIETKLFRFPGGSACGCLNGQGKQYIRKMHEEGYVCFDWNVTGEDSVGNPTAASIYEQVFSNVLEYEKPIVLLHDSKIADQTVEALPQILKRLQEEGCRFEALDAENEYIFPNNREK